MELFRGDQNELKLFLSTLLRFISRAEKTEKRSHLLQDVGDWRKVLINVKTCSTTQPLTSKALLSLAEMENSQEIFKI